MIGIGGTKDKSVQRLRPPWIETDRISFVVELEKKKLRFLANFCMIGGQNPYAATPLLP